MEKLELQKMNVSELKELIQQAEEVIKEKETIKPIYDRVIKNLGYNETHQRNLSQVIKQIVGDMKFYERKLKRKLTKKEMILLDLINLNKESESKRTITFSDYLLEIRGDIINGIEITHNNLIHHINMYIELNFGYNNISSVKKVKVKFGSVDDDTNKFEYMTSENYTYELSNK